MDRRKIALKEGWKIPTRFDYVTFSELSLEDREFVESGKHYRSLGHALPECWLYPVRRDGRLTLCARRLRLHIEKRLQRKVPLLSEREAVDYLERAMPGPWETWSYSGKRQLKLSKGYYIEERLPDLRERMLSAFGAEQSPATPLGIGFHLRLMTKHIFTMSTLSW